MKSTKNNIIIRVLALAILISLFVGGCSPKDRLLGVWTQQGGDLHIRFHTGDLISQRAYFGDEVLTLTGTYEILNDNQIDIQFQEGEWRGLEAGLYDYTIDGDLLTLDGMTFERQPDVYYLE